MYKEIFHTKHIHFSIQTFRMGFQLVYDTQCNRIDITLGIFDLLIGEWV